MNETGVECVLINCDQVNRRGILDEDEVRDGVCQEGGERGGMDGFEILESYGAFLLVVT